MKVVVVDSGMSNIRSLSAALEYLGAPHVVTTNPECCSEATHVIVPGVGAFDSAMRNLAANDLIEPLRDFGRSGDRPFLGVCLGMQLLAESSEEGTEPGLGIVSGRSGRLRSDPSGGRKVPHVGFSRVYGYAPEGLFRGFGDHADFYFTHSYALQEMEGEANIGYCDHSTKFVAAFQQNRICGAQFHPEKSQSTGLRLIANFLELT